MKKILNIILNLFPFVIWMGWFYLALGDIKTIPDLGTIQILLLLFLPLIYSIYNLIFSNNAKKFILRNTIFLISQVVGYYLCGLLYYNYISSDSETALIRNTFSFISIIYIVIITLICCGIRLLMRKIRKSSPQ